MRRKRKVVGAAVAALVALIVVVAATGGSSGSDPAGNAASAGDTLVVAVAGDPPSLDPGPTYAFGWEFAMNIYSTLLTHEIDPETQSYVPDKLAPGLAESWEVADDNKSITLHLNPNATFSDGTPVTAADVAYSVERGLKGKLGYVATQYEAGGITSMDQVEVVDDHTVKLLFPDTMSRLALPNLATEPITILPKKYMEEHATDSDPWASEFVNKKPMGSGPYVLESWKPGQQIVLTARDDYWGAVKPHYKKIVYRIVPDAETRATLLRSRTVDVAYSLSMSQFSQLKGDGALNVISVPAAQDTVTFRMNPKVAPFDDVNVRKAIMKALPYDTIVKDSLYGFGTRSQSLCGQGTPAYTEQDLYTTDVAEAKQLIAASKYGSGRIPAFTLTVPTNYPERLDAAVRMQSALKQIGVRMEIQKLPFAAYTDRAEKRNFGANIHSMGPFFNDCMYWAYWMFDSRSPTNYIGYENAAVDKATEKALTLPVTADDELQQLVDTAIEQNLTRDAIAAPLYQNNWTVAASKELTDVIYWPNLAIEWKYVRPAGTDAGARP